MEKRKVNMFNCFDKSARRPRRWLAVITAMAVVMLASSALWAAETGIIQGKVVDKATGEGLIGANVMLKGTSMGAQTDLDGNFRIKNITPGSYTLVASSVNYEKVEVTGVVIAANDSKTFNLSLQEEATEVEGITVTAKRVENTEATILKNRQKATVVSDAISSQEISRSGAGDAAEAMTKVTGASVVGGKYIYVRGLGDRYASTQLDGSLLPSSDPDRTAAPLDMIPSSLLDNITVEKTFTPDKPGNFAGGSVNLVTRDYPDTRMLEVSSGVSYNTNTTFKTVIGQERSDSEWLGKDGGLRDIPSIITDNQALSDRAGTTGSPPALPAVSATDPNPGDIAYVQYLEDRTKLLTSSRMTSLEREAPLDQSYSVSFGDQFQLFERPVGISASLSYSRSTNFYDDGFVAEYAANPAPVDTLDPVRGYELNEVRTRENVLWGSMLRLVYGIHPLHKIGYGLVRNQHGETDTRELTGAYQEFFNLDPVEYRTRALKYFERSLTAHRFFGEHQVFEFLRGEWQVSRASSARVEPNIRFFSDAQDTLSGNLIMDANGVEPSQSWRDLEETNNEYRLDLIFSLGKTSKFKTGAYFLDKDRTVFESEFEYRTRGNNQAAYQQLQGDVEAWFDRSGVDEAVEVVTDSGSYYQYNGVNLPYEVFLPSNNYDATQQVTAGYGMVEFPVFSRLKMIGGVRFEHTKMEVITTRPDTGLIDVTDALPSVNFVYPLNESMNLRAAYGRTLARPTFREMSPAIVEEFSVARIYQGNPTLDRTIISNFDTRWEWFLRPGEVLAFSVFYKELTNPIELALIGTNGQVQPQNVPGGTVYGVEFEFRRRLDHIHSALANFKIGGNVTLVHSEVDIPEDELNEVIPIGLDRQETRPLYGQSPYIINFDVAYDNLNTGTQMSLFYNRFGRRFAINNENGVPDVYEMPRNDVDLIVKQRVFGDGGPTLKFAAKNLLNEDFELQYDDPEPITLSRPHYYERYSRGVSYSFGISYNIF